MSKMKTNGTETISDEGVIVKKAFIAGIAAPFLATGVVTAQAGEIWWATARYPDTGCVTADQKKEFFNTPADAFAHMQEYAKQHSMTPILRDRGDFIEVGVRKYDDLVPYVYYRSKERCEQAAAAADAIVKTILGAAAKEYRETHPDLDKYR